MRVDLKTFLAEGRLGAVRVGMKKEEILALAGEPAEFARGDSMHDAEIWINGKVTFWFSASELERIGVYYVLEYPSNRNISYDTSFPERGTTTLQHLCNFMSENEIGYTIDESHTRHRVLITNAGVQITAGGYDDVLDSIVFPAVELARRRGKGDA
jgi:hypothetical protein